MPEVYDRCLGLATFAPFAADLALRAPPCPPSRVLELAAGTGIVTAGLVEALPDADITATDLNPPDGHLRLRPRARPDVAGRRRPGPRPRRRHLRPGRLPVRRDVLAEPDRRLPRRYGGCWSPHGSFLFNVWDTLGHLRGARGRVRRAGRGLPRRPAGLPAAGPARVRRPGADPGRRPGGRADRRGAGAGRAGRHVAVGGACWPRASASAPRCGSTCRSAATSPRWCPRVAEITTSDASATGSSRARWRRTSSAPAPPSEPMFEPYGTSHLVVLGVFLVGVGVLLVVGPAVRGSAVERPLAVALRGREHRLRADRHRDRDRADDDLAGSLPAPGCATSRGSRSPGRCSPAIGGPWRSPTTGG